jgi:hypothetical protein
MWYSFYSIGLGESWNLQVPEPSTGLVLRSRLPLNRIASFSYLSATPSPTRNGRMVVTEAINTAKAARREEHHVSG